MNYLREQVRQLYAPRELVASHGRVVLKQVKISSDLFSKILSTWPKNVVTTDNIKQYYRGFKDKNAIAYDGFDTIICTESHLDFIHPLLDDINWWKQVICVEDPSLPEETIDRDISGGYAWNHMMRMLKRKYYTEQEILEILHSYDHVKYDSHKKQYHNVNFSYGLDCYDNCVKYDINSAHASALMEMFPKAAGAIERMYKQRKEKPINKALLNYFVGYFKHKGYEGAYNWVVQRTTKKLLSAIEEVGGLLLYANTDGFMVCDPEKLLKASKKIGEFKEEYRGKITSYIDKNYWYYQQADGEGKGNLPCSLRKFVDLNNGVVVHFNKVKDDRTGRYTFTDIKQETIENG